MGIRTYKTIQGDFIMIVDSMTKWEVMKVLRSDFDNEVLNYYERKIVPVLRKTLLPKAQRENRVVYANPRWEDYSTKNLNNFSILKRVTKDEHTPFFVAEFKWKDPKYKGKKSSCYACFYKNKNMIVMHEHCLDRYKQRKHIDNSIVTRDLFFKYLMDKQYTMKSIVLPSRTHEYSFYCAFAGALFLADFEAEHAGDESVDGVWLNTCITEEEMQDKYTQSHVFETLKFLSDFCSELGYNPLSDLKIETNFEKKIKTNPSFKDKAQNFFVKAYLIQKLQESFHYPWATLMDKQVIPGMKFLEEQIKAFGIDPLQLDPFDCEYGIAKKSEIDYINP